MKKFYNAIIVLIAFHSSEIISQDVEETVGSCCQKVFEKEEIKVEEEKEICEEDCI